MSIIRTKRRTNYTLIDNCVYKDGLLSFRAMGLLSYLLSKPDNWSICVPALIKVTEGTAQKSGRDAVYAAIDELIAARFVIRSKRASGEMDYFIFDEPQQQAAGESPDTGKACYGKPVIGKSRNTGKACYGKPVIREIPITENTDVLINTERPQQELKKDKQELNCSEAAPSEPPGGDLILAVNDKPKPASKANPDNVKTWEAYARAYRHRYGMLPTPNAQTRGMVAKLVKLVGADTAPMLAAFFVQHNDGYFVRTRHALNGLINSYQQVLTDMARGEQMTATKARQTEKTQTNMDVAARLIAKYQAEERAQ